MKYLPEFLGLSTLTIADVFITLKIVGEDLFLEKNPYAAWLIGNYGYFGLFIGKFIPLLVVLIGLLFLSYIVKFYLRFAIVIYFIVVIPGIIISQN
jgi:uncharacterized membrane protein